MNWNGIAFILMLVAFVLITVGIAQENEIVWWAGLVSLALGGLIPPLRRFTEKGEENKS